VAEQLAASQEGFSAMELDVKCGGKNLDFKISCEWF
jgi:hypothetical protein